MRRAAGVSVTPCSLPSHRMIVSMAKAVLSQAVDLSLWLLLNIYSAHDSSVYGHYTGSYAPLSWRITAHRFTCQTKQMRIGAAAC